MVSSHTRSSPGWWLVLLGAGLTAALLITPPAFAAPVQEPQAEDGVAQEPATATPQEETPVFGTGTATVVLDVVVRDKKGRPVLDIRPGEVEVYEEGVRQKVEEFKRVETSIEGGQRTADPDRPEAARHLNLVTLVFDQLGVDGRRQAKRAAESLLDKALTPNTFFAVFRVDQRLSMVAPFTSDKEQLKQAISNSTSGEFIGVVDEQAVLERAMAELERTQGLEGVAGQEGAGAGTDFASRAQAQALVRMIRLANSLQRQQLGGTSLYPLLALVKGQQTLAGRKTLVYFTEQLEVPPSLDAVFRSVISEANRANVSVYSIDARGLKTTGDMDRARDFLDDARRISQEAQLRDSGAVPVEEVKFADTRDAALRANVQGVLQDLSEGTGGFLIANTNNFKPGAEKIAADIAGYYELSYVPPASAFDGRFRPIEVKVAREDVTVQTRSGYFALPPGEASAILPYEVPLLGALTVEKPPSDFTMRVATLRFGPAEGGRDHKLVVEVPIAALEMTTDEALGRYSLHFSLVALIKKEDGEIVERFSEDYPFEGPIERAEALKFGNIVFKRHLTLAPGQYVLEVAGQDRTAGKTSVARARFDVPSSEGGLSMSSLALIRRVDDLPPETQSDDPLDLYNQKRIVPNLDAPISLAANPKLWLFFIAYPGDAGDPPEMTLEFLKGGETIAKAKAPLPAPEPDGLIRYIGNFPTTKFSEGRYDVKVALHRAGRQCEEEASFTIVP